MSRKITSNLPQEQETLEELIPKYAENKNLLDDYKNLCETDNLKIKELMTEQGINSYSAGGYVAKKSIQNKETLNEDKLLAVMKKHNFLDVIKTKEYVDLDALENALYNTELDKDLIRDIDSCRSTKQVVQLRISKEKEE